MGVGSQNQDACAETQANCSPFFSAENASPESASAEGASGESASGESASAKNLAKPLPGQADLDVARSNLLAAGPSVVSDDELLALWLGLTDVRAAANLRQGQDGISALLRAPAGRLMAAPGLGRVRTGRLLAAVALVERAAESGLRAMPALSSSSAVRRFLRLKLSHQPREVFACLFLDNRHRLICFEPLFFGTVDRASVHPREVLRRALEVNAAAVILAHNHPSGVAEPSGSDLALTEDLSDLLRRIDVRVLDHWVIGRGSEVSFAERGFIR